MANKWRTTVDEDNAIFVRYSINPAEPTTETLTRKWSGIDKSVLASLITTLKATKTVTDPKADFQVYSGIWTVKSVEPNPDENGNTSGSADIIQVLSKGSYDYATPDNASLVRNRAYPLEQNENSWMYYERFKSEVTTRWINLTYAGLISAVWDGIRQIRTLTDFDTAVDVADDKYFTYYYHRKFLYSIIYVAEDQTGTPVTTPKILPQSLTKGKYYIPKTAVWSQPVLCPDFDWFFSEWEEIDNPVISECWIEQNSDGTYNLYRTILTTSTSAIMRERSLTYAGMTLVKGLPALDDTSITITGFNNLTERVYQNARFRIGGDIYRVLADADAAAGEVTLSINPAITQATEDLCDANEDNVQVYWDAL